MGKRSNFERVERDFYPTPKEVVVPLVGHLPPKGFTYEEPCAEVGSAGKLRFNSDSFTLKEVM